MKGFNSLFAVHSGGAGGVRSSQRTPLSTRLLIDAWWVGFVLGGELSFSVLQVAVV